MTDETGRREEVEGGELRAMSVVGGSVYLEGRKEVLAQNLPMCYFN